MYGKLFLLAVVCVSFVQVRGDQDLKIAIEEGLKKLWDLTANGGEEIEKFSRYTTQLDHDRYKLYDSTKKQWQDRTTESIASTCGQSFFTTGLYMIPVINEAKGTREEAKNSNNPQGVIECVNKFEVQGRNNLGILYKKYHQQLFEKAIHLYEEIKKQFSTVKQLADDFSESISKAESDIRNSGDATSVERTVAVFELYVKNLERNIAVIRGKIQQGYNNFIEEVKYYDGEIKMDEEKEVSLTKLNIRFCTLIKNAIMAILLGSEK